METKAIMLKNERFWNWLNKSAQKVRLQGMMALAISVAILIIFVLSYLNCASQGFHQRQDAISLQQAGGLLFLLLLQFAVCLKVVFQQQPDVSWWKKSACVVLSVANWFCFVAVMFVMQQGKVASVLMFSAMFAGLLAFGACISCIAGRLDWDKLS